jgi:hypothetical protein
MLCFVAVLANRPFYDKMAAGDRIPPTAQRGGIFTIDHH